MRQVVLDTETTGLDPKHGHRIIEIGCVEIIDRRVTDNHYHQYINPQREVDPGAFKVHGISNDFLANKPLFASVFNKFFDYIKGAQLIIHNAPFDMGFLNYEAKLLDNTFVPLEKYCGVLDTLVLARELHPGKKNNLDALCRRYGIDNSNRDLHGALLDAKILANVYLAMTTGQSTMFDTNVSASTAGLQKFTAKPIKARDPLKVIRANADELKAHSEYFE